MKIDYKKNYKDIYLPKQKPEIIDLKPMKYITIEYEGNPNDSKFQSVMSALYSLSYTVKMKSKKRDDYYEYVVFPLEGFWDLIDKDKTMYLDKDNLKGTLMIRQPDFLDDELFNEYKEMIMNKEKDNDIIERVKSAKLEIIDEGLNIQMMHIGSYDDEPATFAIMAEYAKENNFERVSMIHKEIYLSDPRKVSKDKLRTVLRYKVKEII